MTVSYRRREINPMWINIYVRHGGIYVRQEINRAIPQFVA